MKTPIFPKETGLSLVELLLVLGVVAGILASGTVIGSRVRAHQEADAAIKGVLGLQANVRAHFGQPDYAGVGNPIIYRRLMPGELLRSDGVPSSPWGGPVTIGAGSVGGPNNVYEIILQGVPRQVCQGFVSSVGPSFLRVMVGPTGAGSLRVRDRTRAAGPANINPGQLADACNRTTSVVRLLGD